MEARLADHVDIDSTALTVAAIEHRLDPVESSMLSYRDSGHVLRAIQVGPEATKSPCDNHYALDGRRSVIIVLRIPKAYRESLITPCGHLGGHLN
ncbi:hypothetical protein MRX96_057648 [Rhipicephalus microplus]